MLKKKGADQVISMKAINRLAEQALRLSREQRRSLADVIEENVPIHLKTAVMSRCEQVIIDVSKFLA